MVLPTAQIHCAGTLKSKGSIFEELCLSNEMKEWNGRADSTHSGADSEISRYNITQEYSAFVEPAQLQYRRKNMAPWMFANEVFAQFFAAGGAKPIPTDLLLPLLIKTPAELNNSIFVEKTLGVPERDVFIFEVSQADDGRFRPLRASSGGSQLLLHKSTQPSPCSASLCIRARLPETGFNQNVMIGAPRFAWRRITQAQLKAM